MQYSRNSRVNKGTQTKEAEAEMALSTHSCKSSPQARAITTSNETNDNDDDDNDDDDNDDENDGDDNDDGGDGIEAKVMIVSPWLEASSWR